MVHLFTDDEVEELLEETMNYRVFDRAEIMAFALTLRDAVEKKNFESSIEGVWVEAIRWQEETFPQTTVQSIANHLVKEALELAEKPHDQYEVSDILLLIGHWCYKTKQNIWAVMRSKLIENMSRSWGKVNEQGFVEHVREEKPEVVVRHFMKLDKNGKPYGIGHTGE